MRAGSAALAAALGLALQAAPASAQTDLSAGAAGSADGANAVLIDSNGDVISGGTRQDPGPTIVLIKHSGADGSELWRVTQPGFRDGGIFLFEDGDGAVVAALYRYGTPDSTVLKVSADGELMWLVDLAGVELRAADLSAAGELAVAGRSAGAVPDDWDGFVAVLDAAGQERWRGELSGGLMGAAEEQLRAVRFDADGGVVIGGGLLANAALERPDFAVVRLDAGDGAERWRAIVPSVAARGGDAYALALDPRGDVVAVGGAMSADGCDAVAVKLAGESGAERWQTVIDEPGGSSCEPLTAVAVNEAGDVFATGAPSTIGYAVFELSGASGALLGRRDFPNEADPPGGGGGKAIALRGDDPAETSAHGSPCGLGPELALLLPLLGRLRRQRD